MAQIIDGKAIAATMRQEIKEQARCFNEKHGRKPGLAVLLVGDDPASCIYVKNKQKACEKADINAQTYRLSGESSTEELLALIDSLNLDASVDGILVQLPLPKHMDETAVLNRILPEKDVDGLERMVSLPGAGQGSMETG